MSSLPFHRTILEVEDTTYTIGFRQRQCRRTLLTERGVLTCERSLNHRGSCAALEVVDGQEVLIRTAL